MVIRPATIDDSEALVQLRIELMREMGHVRDEEVRVFADATRKYLARALPAGEFLAWVAEERAVVATSGLVLFRRPPSPLHLMGMEAYLLNMYTVPVWRGKGIASALMHEILTNVRELGIERVWLHATEDGRPLYERTGFTPNPTAMELVILGDRDDGR